MFAAHGTGAPGCAPPLPRAVVHATCNKILKDEDRNAQLVKDHVAFLMVADGHGGPEVATLAATSLLDQIAKAAVEQSLETAMSTTFLALHAEGRAKFKSAGSTCTVVVVDRLTGLLTCSNVGDSQAFLVLSDGEVLPLGVDHRFDTNRAECERVESSGGKIGRAINPRTQGPAGPLRGWPGGLAMGRSLGDGDCGDWLVAEPTCKQTQLPAGGGWIVIASDGVWDAISAEVAGKIVRGHGDNPAKAADKVVAAAIKARGLRDDTTCTVAMVGTPVAAELSASPTHKMSVSNRIRKMVGREREAGQSSDEDSGSRSESPPSLSVKGGKLFERFSAKNMSPPDSPSPIMRRPPPRVKSSDNVSSVGSGSSPDVSPDNSANSIGRRPSLTREGETAVREVPSAAQQAAQI